jgi:hypothetical protein
MSTGRRNSIVMMQYTATTAACMLLSLSLLCCLIAPGPALGIPNTMRGLKHTLSASEPDSQRSAASTQQLSPEDLKYAFLATPIGALMHEHPVTLLELSQHESSETLSPSSPSSKSTSGDIQVDVDKTSKIAGSAVTAKDSGADKKAAKELLPAIKLNVLRHYNQPATTAVEAARQRRNGISEAVAMNQYDSNGAFSEHAGSNGLPPVESAAAVQLALHKTSMMFDDPSMEDKLSLPGIMKEQQAPLTHTNNQPIVNSLTSYSPMYPRRPVEAVPKAEYERRHGKPVEATHISVGKATKAKDASVRGALKGVQKITLKGHIERPNQVEPDAGIKPSTPSPVLNPAYMSLRNVTRECPRTPCGPSTSCSWGKRGICCAGGNHCCPPNATCLNTNPPTCKYDLASEPARCLTEYCLEDNHCPIPNIRLCCSGGETCCPMGYECSSDPNKCTRMKRSPFIPVDAVKIGGTQKNNTNPFGLMFANESVSIANWAKLRFPKLNTAAKPKPTVADAIIKGQNPDITQALALPKDSELNKMFAFDMALRKSLTSMASAQRATREADEQKKADAFAAEQRKSIHMTN